LRNQSSDVPPFEPADVAQLPPLIASFPTLFLQEVGPEGNNGAFYTPNPGDPGYDPTVGLLAYNFISDVPEPATMALLGLGVPLVLRRRRAIRA
jgi:hypothetical protein